jgi:hypothetical protein
MGDGGGHGRTFICISMKKHPKAPQNRTYEGLFDPSWGKIGFHLFLKVSLIG